MTGKRIELAPQNRLSGVEHLAPRFFQEVLGRDYAECLITDESRLSDFANAFAGRAAAAAEVQGFFAAMERHYLLDGRPVGTGIVDLLEFLSVNGVQE